MLPLHPSSFAPYRRNHLVFKVRASAARVVSAFEHHEPTIARSDAPGLHALHHHLRAGRVNRLTAVGRATRAARLGPHLTAALSDPHGIHGGILAVELGESVSLASVHAALAHDPHVEFVARVPARYAFAVPRRHPAPPSNPFPLIRGWDLAKIRWAEARKLKGFRDARDITVALLDTGVQEDHPGLRIHAYTHGYDDLQRRVSGRDIVGHGTHMAGIVAGRPANDLGIRGVCRCRVAVWKIFEDDPPYDPQHRVFAYVVDPVLYWRALSDCLARRVDVINLSFGGPARPDPHEQALFDALRAKGTSMVAAMGNQRQAGSPTSYPAALPGIIAVGATDEHDVVAPFSSRGRHIALTAPGVAIWSTLPAYPGQFGFRAKRGPDGRPRPGAPVPRNTVYDGWLGTSVAVPHVTAAAALLLAKRGPMHSDRVRQRLMRTADRVPRMRGRAFDPDYGAGRLNLLRLLRT